MNTMMKLLLVSPLIALACSDATFISDGDQSPPPQQIPFKNGEPQNINNNQTKSSDFKRS